MEMVTRTRIGYHPWNASTRRLLHLNPLMVLPLYLLLLNHRHDPPLQLYMHRNPLLPDDHFNQLRPLRPMTRSETICVL